MPNADLSELELCKPPGQNSLRPTESLEGPRRMPIVEALKGIGVTEVANSSLPFSITWQSTGGGTPKEAHMLSPTEPSSHPSGEPFGTSFSTRFCPASSVQQPASEETVRPVVRLLSRIFCLALLAASAHAQPSSQPSSQPAAPTPQPLASDFLHRLATFYREDWSGTAPASPEALRRGLPSPLESPPFPSEDWSYGGSPVLGEPDGNSYPFMAAINRESSRTKLYGWLDPSVNGSTSSHSNAPEANDLYSDRLELNQAVLYVERLPDTVQREHFDFGYHLTVLFGTDYRYTIDKGYGLTQLLENRQYGVDPALEYIDLYLPNLGIGLSTNLRIGRFISIPGIEAQLSPNNYFFSHSLLYAVDPFTDTGVLATVQLNPQWIVQAGITASHDVAPWIRPDAQPSADFCLDYTTRTADDNFYLCANGINDGRYAFNNLQQYDGTWYHKFNKNWHIATEAYAMYERQVPGATQPALLEAGTTGAACQPGQVRCFAPAWAIENYVNRQLDAHSFIGFRSDFLNDKKGQRTGYATRYSENTLSYNRWIGTTVQLRPEIRFDHAWDRPAYDRGTRQSQFTAATDLILHF